LDNLEATLEPLIGALADELKAPAVHADVLGALRGTRLQARVFAGRRNAAHYAIARRDSDAAIAGFVGSQDLDRQYLYRCHLETDVGKLVEALGWLGRALHVHPPNGSSSDIAGDVRTIAEALGSGPPNPFHLRHYCRLWAAASASPEQKDLATVMTNAWLRLPTADQIPKKLDEYLHPWEVIDWKAGVALLRNGHNAGKQYVDRAIDRCLINDPARPLRAPIYTIGLACLAETAALLHDTRAFPGYLKQLQRKTREMFDDRTRFPESMRTYFGAWREDVQGAPAPDTLLRLARDVAY
jgi:hypothetical protein